MSENHNPSFMTPDERAFAVQYLTETRDEFIDAIRGLNSQQWFFRPEGQAWSLAQIAEHVAVAEDLTFRHLVGKVLASDPQPDLRAKVQGKEELLFNMVAARVGKVEAPEFLRPVGHRESSGELISVFSEFRNRAVEFARSTESPLRDHFFPHPVLQQFDAYQWLLFIGAHCRRHAMQILELKNNPAFPPS